MNCMHEKAPFAVVAASIPADEIGQVASYRSKSSMRAHMLIEQLLAVQLDAMRMAHHERRLEGRHTKVWRLLPLGKREGRREYARPPGWWKATARFLGSLAVPDSFSSRRASFL